MSGLHPTVREALAVRFVGAGLLAPGAPVEDRLHDRWVRVRVFGRLVPVKPMLGYQEPVLLHDVHHLVTGYGTSLRGELEIAAWEVASGGCGPYPLFWLGRVYAMGIGLLVCPVRTFRAFRRGLAARNLYEFPVADLLERDVDDVRAYVAKA